MRTGNWIRALAAAELMAVLPLMANDALAHGIAGKDAELTPDQMAPMTDRGVLLRLQNNIKLRRLRATFTPAAEEGDLRLHPRVRSGEIRLEQGI